MKRILIGLLLALAWFQPANSQEKLVLMSWGGLYGQHMKEAWFDPFEKATGIKVELRLQNNMMDTLAKLRVQKEQMGIDIWINAVVPTMVADGDGLVVAVPRDKITNAKDLDPQLISDKYVAAWSTFYGIIYDKNKAPFQITKWTDLADPRLKGMVTVPDGTQYGGKFIALLAWLNGGDEKNIDPAFDMLKKIKPNVILVFKSDSETLKMITAGEAVVAPMMQIGNYLQIKQAGPQYTFVAPEPFVPANFQTFTVIKGAKQEAAWKFIDFAISAPAQEEFAKRIGVIPVNNKAAVPEAFKAFVPARDRLRYIDDAIVSKQLPAWADRWNRELQDR